ncbi:MAG: S41 family peptidase [Chitinophagales bacterium]
MKKIIYSIFIIIVSLSQACIKDDVANNNEAIFNYIWTEMDENYGGFIPRKINWDSIYVAYQPLAMASNTEDELWDICTSIIDVFDDQHIAIVDDVGKKGFASGKIGDELLAEKEFNINVIKEQYLENNFTALSVGDEDFVYGTIKNKNIGYIYMPHFSNINDWYFEIDTAIEALLSTDGLIVDIRNNGGGAPLIDRYVASRFIAERKLAFSIQTRNGEAHTDFDEPTVYFAEAAGNQQYTKPTILLINHSTVSAGEEFALFLETQNHITVVGDTTSNAFSTVAFTRFLPNGWRFMFPNQLYSYPDGSSPEGVGIIPDIYFQNDSLDIQNNIDKVLEKGIELL